MTTRAIVETRPKSVPDTKPASNVPGESGGTASGAAANRKRGTRSSEPAQRKFSLLEKEGKLTRRLMDYYQSNKTAVFAVEFRPNKKRSDGEWMCAHKMAPEESWTSVKRVDVRLSS